MKKTSMTICKLTVLLLCLTFALGLFVVGASAANVSEVKVGNVTLSGDYWYVIDTGFGYEACKYSDFDEESDVYVAKFIPSSGTLTLQNYNGGPIYTNATGDLTISLIGNNTITTSDSYAHGIDMRKGGNLTVTSTDEATLTIQNTPSVDPALEYRYVGIANNYQGGAEEEKSGDGVTISGKASVTITSSKTLSGSGEAIGIAAYGGIMVLENASLDITATNEKGNLARGIYSLSGMNVINTTGDVSISVSANDSYDVGENLFQGNSTTLGAVGRMELNWTYEALNTENMIIYSDGLTDDNYIIGTLADDTTSKTYGFKYAITVTDGVAKVDGVEVDSAAKGQTVTLIANTPEAGTAFASWNNITEGGSSVTVADPSSPTTTFTMLAEKVDWDAEYQPLYTITVNKGTASTAKAVSGTLIYLLAAEPDPGYVFAGWTSPDGVTFSDASAPLTNFILGDGSVTVTATYTPIDYMILVTDGTAKIGDTSVTEASVEDTVTLTANDPATGYVFKEWSITSGNGTLADATSATTTLTGITSEIQIEAIYEKETFTVTTTYATATDALGNPVTSAQIGDSFTVVAEVRPGTTFNNGWDTSGGTVTSNAATTTFIADGTGNISIEPVYNYIDYTVTITGGLGYVDHTPDQITDAHVGDTVSITADDPAEGKAFIRWEIRAGEITLADPTNYITSFTMIAGDVEIEPIYADIVVLDRLDFTMTTPTVGAHPSFVLTPADPTKYGYDSESLYIYLNEDPYPHLTDADVYLLGKAYVVEFQYTLANGYEVDENTKFYVNGVETVHNGLWKRYHFEFPVPITVTGGKAYSNSERTEQITSGRYQYVYLKADETPEGKQFMGWVVRSGDITISNADYEEASFSLKDEPVTVEAVFATVLDEVVLTVTKPKVGDLATIEITSADPEKYTAVLNAFTLGKDPYTTLLPTDTFEHGNPYDMRFEIIAADGYTVTYDTVITLNGEETSCYGGAEQQEWSFRLPVLVTVTDGKAYTTSSYESEIGEVYPGNYVYLKAGDAPEGKKFLAWKITDDGGTYYYHYDTSWYIHYSITTLTCEVIWAIPIDTVVGTMSPITVGQTPITTVTDSSDLYDIVIDTWYYYDEERNEHEMLPTDTYQPNVEYKCEFSIIPIDGYFIDRENVEITINNKQLFAFGYSSGTGIVHARAYYLDTVYINFDITGGKLYLDGVETNETKFLPGTTLTLVADESLYPEGEVFKEWNTSYIYNTIVGVTDYRFPTLTFTVGVPSEFDSTIVIEAQYQALTQINYGPYTAVPHPTVGGTPSYDTNVPSYQNYHGEVLDWYEGETLLEPSHVFEEGKVYTVKIRLTPAAGYYFRDAEYYDSWEPSNSFNGTDVDGILLECDENGAYLIFTASIQAKHYEDSASVTVTAPVAGMAPDKTVTKSADTYCDVDFSRWEVYDEETEWYREMLDGELFEVGKTYRIYVTFTTNETYYIDVHDLEVLINGTEPTYCMGGTVAGGYSTCGYYLQFTVEAGEPYDVVVDGGTASVDASPVTEAGGGIVVTITANAPDPGKAFKCWEIVSGENVFLLDATASTTTFVMPAGDVSIKAVYRNTPHDITVEGGEADITFAGSGETITVTAGDAPDGKYFAGWECIAGGVTFTDDNAKTTTFVMTGEAVEVRVIWADKIYLEELTLTVTKPANGNLPSEEITSADPTKYTATFDYWWDNFNNREMGAEDVFSYGIEYGLVFYLELDEKYYIDSSTAVTVNGETSGYYSSNPPYLRRYVNFHAPVPVTVEGGVATNSSDVTITEQQYGNIVYLSVGEIPEGKSFLRWEVVSGGVTISNVNQASAVYFYMYTREPVVIRAVFQDVLYNVTVTDGTASHTTAVAGTTVTLTADTAPADHVFDKWVIVSGTVTFANANNAETTFTMPAGAVSVKATYKEVEKIPLTEVNVTLDVPVLGEKPDFTATIPNDAHYSVLITWENSANGWTEMTEDSVFENGFFYDVCIKVIPSEGYKVDSTTVLNLNGTEIDLSGNPIYHSFTFWEIVDGPEIPEDAEEITDQNSTPYSYEGNTATYDAVNGWTSVIDVDGYYSAVNLELKAGDVVYYQFSGVPSDDVYLYDFTSRNCAEIYVDGYKAISSLTGALTAPADATYAFEYWASSSIPVKLYVVRAAAGGVTVPSGAEEITDQNASAATKDENTATYDAANGWTGIDTSYRYDLFTLDLKAGDTLYYSINGSTAIVRLRDKNGISHYYGSDTVMPAVGQIVVQIDGTYTFAIDDDNSTTEGTTVKVYVVRASGEAHTHANGTKQTGKAATCTEPGWKDYYKCSCGALFADAACTTPISYLDAWKAGDGKLAIDADAHSFGSTYTSNGDGRHYAVCEHNAEHKQYTNCSGGTPSCTQKATCSVCGSAYGDLAEHSYGELIAKVPAKHTSTELTAGMEAHYECSVCHKLFDQSKVEKTEAELTIAAPTHSYGDWVQGDSNHWKACECGKQTELGAHVYDDDADMICNTCGYDRSTPHTHGNGTKVNGQSATCTADGWKDYYQCSCGKYYSDAACTTEITDLVAWKAGDGKLAASHTPGTLIPEEPATCTDTGMAAHYECSVCHKLFDENGALKTEAELTLAIDADAHEFGAWASNGDGTHTRVCAHDATHKETESCSGGTATCKDQAVCSVCGSAYGSLAEHSYGTLIPEDPAKHSSTELATGMKAHYECSVCHKLFDQNKVEKTEAELTIAAPTHSYGDWVQDNDNHWKACECGKQTELGAHVYDDDADMICNTCGYDRSTPHTHGNGSKINGQSATCTTDGWKDYYQCSCGKYYSDAACTTEIIDLVAWKAGDGKLAAAHTLGTLIPEDPATCKDTGMKAHYECSVCHKLLDENGAIKTEAELTIAIDSDAHTFGAWSSNGDGTHTRVCAHDASHKETENCSGGTATCKDKAVCQTCNTAYGSLAEHAYGTLIAEVPATCSDTGMKAHYECSVCHKLFDQNKAEKSEADLTIAIDADAHAFGAWASNGDGTHTRVCSHDASHKETESCSGGTATCTDKAVCQTCNTAYGNLAEHVFGEWTVTLEPTEKAPGSRTKTCSCGHSITEEIPALGKDGLSAGAIAAIVVGSVAVAGVGGFAVWWFVISKKTFAQLGAACKGIASKIGSAFSSLGAKIKGLFSKKKGD